MIRRPPRSTLFPTRRSSDLQCVNHLRVLRAGVVLKLRNLQSRIGDLCHPISRVVSVCCISTGSVRSEEHTSELQSLAYLVCRLLLEKKKKKNIKYRITIG